MGTMLFGRSACSVVVLASVLSCAEEGTDPAPKGARPDPVETEVRERCSDFAARLCASAADCCESTVSGFSPARCAASFTSEFCGPAASVVAAGRAEYHPEAEEPCLVAWARAHATCVADWEEIVAIRREVWSACKMVRGNDDLGSGCSTSSTCQQPDGPVAGRCLADPITRQPTCQLLEILEQGAACPFPNGEVSVCDVGLYCTSIERDQIGTCERAVPEGEACDATVVSNPECGMGNFCDLESGICRRATNFGGPSCSQGSECVSFECQRSSGTCTEPLSTAADLCARGES